MAASKSSLNGSVSSIRETTSNTCRISIQWENLRLLLLESFLRSRPVHGLIVVDQFIAIVSQLGDLMVACREEARWEFNHNRENIVQQFVQVKTRVTTKWLDQMVLFDLCIIKFGCDVRKGILANRSLSQSVSPTDAPRSSSTSSSIHDTIIIILMDLSNAVDGLILIVPRNYGWSRIPTQSKKCNVPFSHLRLDRRTWKIYLEKASLAKWPPSTGWCSSRLQACTVWSPQEWIRCRG